MEVPATRKRNESFSEDTVFDMIGVANGEHENEESDEEECQQDSDQVPTENNQEEMFLPSDTETIAHQLSLY